MISPFRGTMPKDLQKFLDDSKKLFDRGIHRTYASINDYNRLLDLIPEKDRCHHRQQIHYLNGVIKRKR